MDREQGASLLDTLDDECWNDHPVLLLPVHLETRFIGNDLWVRIYPDEIPDLPTLGPALGPGFAGMADRTGGALE